jgi:hypothetical protein
MRASFDRANRGGDIDRGSARRNKKTRRHEPAPRFYQNLPFICPRAAIKKTQSLPAMERRVILGKNTMRIRWSIAIHSEERGEDSLISEDHFVHFADVHQRMKRNKDKIVVVRIPATAKPMEVRAFNNLRRLGYRIETT